MCLNGVWWTLVTIEFEEAEWFIKPKIREAECSELSLYEMQWNLIFLIVIRITFLITKPKITIIFKCFPVFFFSPRTMFFIDYLPIGPKLKDYAHDFVNGKLQMIHKTLGRVEFKLTIHSTERNFDHDNWYLYTLP